MNKVKIVIITPCRNEEQFLPGLIESMKQQSLRPVEWIIVDDGSTDKTGEIAGTAESENDWIRCINKPDRGVRSVGPGVVETFYYGYNALETEDWDYICKLDGDLILPRLYFETLVSYFEQDSILGAASGKLFLELENGKTVEERNSDETVWGCTNFYRRKCFEDIGGFVNKVMWDGIAFHRARMAGWRTRSIRDERLRITEKRIMGASHVNIYKGRRRWGRGQYFIGTHPLYVLAICFYRLFERPFILGGLNILIGYLHSMIKRAEQFNYPGFKSSLRAWQFERIKLGRRKEILPEPPEGLYKYE